jgi:phage baseplate assembly protein W
MSFDLKIVRGDLAIDSGGDVVTVYGNDKLRQDIIKILLTKPGENKFFPGYGSAVGMLEIGSVPDPDFVIDDLETSVESAINKVMSIQRKQAKRQYLSPGEVIVEILDVSAERDQNDPRVYNIFISVLTQELTPITEVLPIRII